MKQVSNHFVEQHEKCGVRANFISVDKRKAIIQGIKKRRNGNKSFAEH